MRARQALGALLAIASTSGHAAAEPKHNAISWEPFALLSRGMLVQYERLVSPKASLVGGVGARFGARDDFESETWTLKAEGRYWLRSAERSMSGPYLGLTSVVARTSLRSRRYDRDIGAYWQVEESARFGYRFIVFDLQEITPSAGLSVIHEFDERGVLAPITRGTLGVNLSVGWLF